MTLDEITETMDRAIGFADDRLEDMLRLQRENRDLRQKLAETQEKLDSARRTIRVLGGLEIPVLEKEFKEL